MDFENEIIWVTIASHPARHVGLVNRVKELLPQLTGPNHKLRLYLNNYPSSILNRLPTANKHLEIILAGKCVEKEKVLEDRSDIYPDLRSHGKFFKVAECRGIYLSCDDDIRYPPNYVMSMYSGLARYNFKAICSFHGGFFPVDETGLINHPCPRRACERRTFEQLCETDTQVHICGGGITGFYPDKIGFVYVLPTNCLEGDDENIAVWAQQNEVPLIRLAHRARWCRSETITSGMGALCLNQDHVIQVDKTIREWRHWHLPTIQKG